MKLIFVLIIWIGAIGSSVTAQANCFWEVSTRLVGHRPASTIAPARNWPLVSQETRLQTRTPGGWWSTSHWPVTRTDARGFARIRSAIAFADPVCQLQRDIRVQIRSFSTGNRWKTVHQQTQSMHSNHTGIFSPAPVHRVAVGNLVLQGDYEGNGVVFVQGMTEPPIELTSVESDTQATASAEPIPQNNDDNQLDDVDIEANDDPCRGYRLSVNSGVEFRFGQLIGGAASISSDNALRAETRANGSGTMTLNRITNHIRVENAGSREFNAIHQCPVEVHVRIKETPTVRPDDGWSNPWVEKLPDILPNQTVPVEIRMNLWGSGDDLVGQWSQEYDYLRIEVTIDAENRINEVAESDNQITHCYHAPSNSFVSMSNCGSD